MAEEKVLTNEIVNFTDEDGNLNWAAENSKAYQKHLQAKAKQKPKTSAAAPAPAKSDTKS